MGSSTKRHNIKACLIASAVSLTCSSGSSYAQSENQSVTEIEEIVVTGARRTIQDSIELKRSSTEIVDGLSADEIGDIPALSIGEALETLTGVASHRENGGATEVSIRGLGPFLTNTVINGREATNGAGNRAVNFSIFPSELFNTVGTYKTQSASFIEGAVGGQVALDTKSPIEHGEQSIQLNLKGAYSPNEANIVDGQDIGFRGTASYIDQFETESSGTVGVSIGVQTSDTTNPEQESTISGTFRNCAIGADGQFLQQSGNCQGESVDIENPEDDRRLGYAASSRTFRQNQTSDQRDSVFAVFEWQPNDKVDIMLDAQYSIRDQDELRSDLVFAESNRNVTGLVDDSNGVLQSFTSAGEIQSITQSFSREEEYNGIALNIGYQVNDDLNVSVDASYSNTFREELERSSRLGLESGNSSDDVSIFYDLYPGDSEVPQITLLENFDVNDPSNYVNGGRLRLRDQIDTQENTISALRGDFELLSSGDFVTSFLGGARFSKLEYENKGNSNNDISDFTDGGLSETEVAEQIVAECANAQFPESDFLSEVSGANGFVTNGITGVSTNTYATFDLNCSQNILFANTDDDFSDTLDDFGLASADVEEETIAAYLQANFETTIAGLPARGNFGARIVSTEVTSTGRRTALTSTTDPDTGEVTIASNSDVVTEQTTSNRYTEVLPSFTLIVDYSDDVVLRGGIFRGLSRPSPSAMGFGRSISSGTFDSIDEALSDVSATGNPALEALTSWNIDAAVEWYVNDDTLLAFGAYYKNFQGGFEQVLQEEEFFVNGQAFTTNVVATQVTDETSDLYGFEVTATHAFDYLPGFWGGFGAKLSYNYADSNFEFFDGDTGAGVSFDDGVATEFAGVSDPAGLFGLSNNVFAGQLYWSGDKFDAQLIYKSREQYFQQFTRGSVTRLRYVTDADVLELRLGYDITDNVTLSFEALNILDEPRIDNLRVEGNVSQVLSYGPRYFVGLKARF